MVIQSIPMIKLLRRGQLALMAEILRNMNEKPSCPEDLKVMVIDLDACEKLINDFDSILKAEEHASNNG